MRRLIPLAALLLAAAALAFASYVSVPGGCHAFRRARGSTAWSVLSPGGAMRIPWLHEIRIVRDAQSGGGRFETRTREGAAVPIAWSGSVTWSPRALAEAARGAEAPETFVDLTAKEAILSAASSVPGDLLASGGADEGLSLALAEALRRHGFDIASAKAAVGSPNDEDRADSATPARRLAHPIVLLGLDGADWEVAEPLIAKGRLPVLDRLRRTGAWGHLRSSTPTLSPLLWTTAVTGKGPDQHGIVDFLVPDRATGRPVPISSVNRRVKALWSIFGEQGLSSDIVAWWATWPAEPIRGAMITDRVAYSLFDVGPAGAGGKGIVHPASLWPAVRSRVVDAADVTDQEVRRIAKVDGAEIARAREILKSGQAGASHDRLAHLMRILAGTKTYHAVAMDLIGRGQADLTAIYYQGIDEVSHRFAHCAAPALPTCDPADAVRYGGAIDAFYEMQDALLGEILARIDPASYVIVLSDHGFRHGGDRPRDETPDIEGKPGKWHRLYGVAVVSGPGIPPGRLENVTLLDIAPTVLAFASLPAASDMSGRALVSAGGNGARPPALATYETGAGPALASAAAPEPADEGGAQQAMLENLRSLGYIGAADLPPQPRGGESAGAAPGAPDPAGTPPTLTAHANVGAIHLQKGEVEEAEREFDAALRISDAYFPALMGLAEVRLRQKRLDDALALAKRAMESPSPEPSVYLVYAGISIKLRRQEEAAAALSRLQASRPAAPLILVARSILEEDAGRAGRAESLLRDALRMDPAGTEAMSRLFQMERRSGSEASLEPLVREALRRNPSSVMHRNWLALILERGGDAAGAERELRAALATAPDFGGTMANLGSLYGRQGRLEEAIALLSKALRIEPGNLECRVNLGAALGKLGRTDEALAVLEEGMKQGAGRAPQILNALAVTWARKGESRKAADLLRESLSIDPGQPKIREMLESLTRGV